MRALILGDAEKANIRMLREYAAANAVPLAELRERAAALKEGRPTPGFNQFSITIPVGFLVTYTVEHHPKGPMRHLSVSVDNPERVPNPPAVQLLMEEFGFINNMMNCLVYKEDIDNGGIAMNIVEPLDGNWKPHLV